jgi:hypothetical protein
MSVFVGLDVSLATVAICIVDEQGRVVWQGITDSTPDAVIAALESWKADLVRVGLEAGPSSEWIGGRLIEASFPAVCLETRHVKAALAAMTIKTDRNDARGLAQIVRTGWFRPVHIKSAASQRHRTRNGTEVLGTLDDGDGTGDPWAAAAIRTEGRSCNETPLRRPRPRLGRRRPEPLGYHGAAAGSTRKTRGGDHAAAPPALAGGPRGSRLPTAYPPCRGSVR